MVGFERIILNDKHSYLIALLKAAQSGHGFPNAISEDEYRYIRDNKDKDPALAGFAGFGCSFGGIWFTGYARSKRGDNYAATFKKSLLDTMEKLKNAEIMCGDYRDVPLPPHSVIYADPPYKGTEGYRGVGRFDSEAFWEYMRQIARDGHTVFISEMNAPSDFKCIWQKETWRTCGTSNNTLKATEKLFIYNGADVK